MLMKLVGVITWMEIEMHNSITKHFYIAQSERNFFYRTLSSFTKFIYKFLNSICSSLSNILGIFLNKFTISILSSAIMWDELKISNETLYNYAIRVFIHKKFWYLIKKCLKWESSRNSFKIPKVALDEKSSNVSCNII